jgi:hypothetical protein
LTGFNSGLYTLNSNTGNFITTNQTGSFQTIPVTGLSGYIPQFANNGTGLVNSLIFQSGSNILIGTGAVNGFFYKSSNNFIGINNNNPLYTLDVSGSGNFTGSLNLNGQTVVNSPNITTINQLTQSSYNSLSGNTNGNTLYIITNASLYGPISYPIAAINTNYSVGVQDYTLNCTASLTLSLPTSIGVGGQIYNIKNGGTGTVTLNAASGEYIDGNSFVLMSTQYEAITIQSTNSSWIII